MIKRAAGIFCLIGALVIYLLLAQKGSDPLRGWYKGEIPDPYSPQESLLPVIAKFDNSECTLLILSNNSLLSGVYSLHLSPHGEGEVNLKGNSVTFNFTHKKELVTGSLRESTLNKKVTFSLIQWSMPEETIILPHKNTHEALWEKVKEYHQSLESRDRVSEETQALETELNRLTDVATNEKALRQKASERFLTESERLKQLEDLNSKVAKALIYAQDTYEEMLHASPESITIEAARRVLLREGHLIKSTSAKDVLLEIDPEIARKAAVGTKIQKLLAEINALKLKEMEQDALPRQDQ